MENLQHELEILCDSIQKRTITSDAEYPVDSFENVICEIFGVTIKAIKGQTRKEEVTVARHLCMWHLKHTTKLSLSRIGKRYRRNHSTVIFAIRSINDLIETNDKKYHLKIEQFINYVEHEKRKTIDSREIDS